MADFHVYRTAAERALHSAPLYREADGHYQFKYLPAFAVAVAPLAWLPTDVSKVLWFIATAVLLVVFVRRSTLALPDRRRPVATIVLLTIPFMAKFYAHEVTLGQTNVLLGVMAVTSLASLQAGAFRTAGLLAGGAVFVKPYALILLPLLVFGAAPGAATAALAVITIGLVLPAALYGWSGNLALLAGWYHTVTGSTEGNLLGADNISLAAMWAKWLGVGFPATLLAAGSTMVLFGVAFDVWRRRGSISRPAYLEYSLLMLLVPLVSPQGWDYVLLLGTPAVVCVIDRWPELSWRWKAWTAVSLVLMGLTVYDLMGRELYARFMALSIITLAAFGLVAVLVHLRHRGLA